MYVTSMYIELKKIWWSIFIFFYDQNQKKNYDKICMYWYALKIPTRILFEFFKNSTAIYSCNLT